MTTNETKTRPPLWSHLLVAVATVAAVLVVQRWLASPPTAAQPTAQPTATADVSANSATPDASSKVEEVAPAAAVTATQTERAPLRIVFSPTSLRVWHNTRMRFHVTPAEDRSFVQYTWHFEDGSAPANGEEVEHTFPESVTDRFISVEAVDGDGKTVVVSKRLPIERLEIAPIDGQAPSVRTLPKPRGPRILFARDLNKGVEMANFASQLRQWRVALLILSTSPEAAQRTAKELLKQGWRGATLTWSAQLQSAEDETAPPSALGPPLTLVADPDNTLRHQPKSLIWTLGEAALVAHDSRGLVTSEEELQEVTGALTTASAYPNALLLTARPLAPIKDDEVSADRSFRIYEQALRSRTTAVIHNSSGVAYDGRYGGLFSVSVGSAAPEGCARFRGSDACQQGTVTLVELRDRGRPRVWHLRAPSLTAWLRSDVLPGAVGKYRR